MPPRLRPPPRRGATWHRWLASLLGVWLAWAAWPGPALAQPAAAPLGHTVGAGAVRLTVELDRSTLALDDQLRLSLRVEAPGELVVRFPDLIGQLGPFAVTGQQAEAPARLGSGRTVWQQSYQLMPEDVGELTLPALEVAYRQGAAGAEARLISRPMVVTVSSVVPADADVYAPKDVAPPVALPRAGWPIGLWLVSGVLALAVLLAWFGWRRRRRPGRAEVRLPAQALALDQLDRLRRADLIGQGRFEEFYVRLSGILRDFAAAEFRLPAPLRTTEELLALIDAGDGPLSAHRELLGGLLAEADRVKFAAQEPAADVMRRALTRAIAFIERAADPGVPSGARTGASEQADRPIAADLAPTGRATARASATAGG